MSFRLGPVMQVLAALILVAFLATSAQAREFRSRRKFNSNGGGGGASFSPTEATITIPDTGKIDSELLKTVAADKFLSLWYIFVLGGPTKNTDKPWTLFVPLNSGLPGPGSAGFLSDKETTKQLLLNHAVLGQALDPAHLAGTGGDVATQTGTKLLFTKEKGISYVNGIRITGDQFSVTGGSVIVIESFLPILAAVGELATETQTDPAIKEQNKFNDKHPEILVPDAVVTSKPEVTSSVSPIIATKKIRPSPFLVNKRKKILQDPISASDNKNSLTQDGINKSSNIRKNTPERPSARTTRFDKFKKNKSSSTSSPFREKSLTSKQAPFNVPFSPSGRSLFKTFTSEASPTAESSFIAKSTTTEISSIITEKTELTTPELLETTTVIPSPTPDIFAMFSTAAESTTQISSESLLEETTDELNLVPGVEVETETPFLAFDTFVKTTTNGKHFFSESVSDQENKTKDDNPILSNIDDLNVGIEPEIEFLTDSDFVPFNEFLNSQTATEKFNEAFEILPERGEVNSRSNGTIESNSSNFLTWLKSEVKSRQQLGGKEFLHHLLDSGVYKELTSDHQYTALIPTDEAFYAYYPIDWGFNPFLVESFLRRTLLEHLLEGDVAIETLPDGAQLNTLAGTTLTVHNTGGSVTVAGQRLLTESEVLSPYGRLYSLNSLIHVTAQTVKMLRVMNPHLERAPLLGSPWPMSQFLSHLLQRLRQDKPYTGQDNTVLFADYLSQAHIAHLATSSDNFKRMEYTALVPSDASILSEINARGNTGAPVDPYLEDADARNRMVGSHILKGRHTIASLKPGTTVTTLLNETLAVTANEDGSAVVGGATLVPPGESIYNLGALFLVRGPLSLEVQETKTEQPAALQSLQPRVVTRTEVSVTRRVNNGRVEEVSPAAAAKFLSRRLH